MHQRVRKRVVKGPLLVKEVILPCNYSNDNPQSSKNSNFLHNNNNDNDKAIIQNHNQIRGNRYKTMGQQEVEEVFNLMVIREKPLENYFEGTLKGKKVRKRKRRHSRTVIPPSELFSDGGQTLSKGERKQTKKGLTEEEKTEIQLLDLKIYEYEKKREQECRKNYMRQKKAEEDYICQLESLAAKWFETKMRRCIAKGVCDDVILPESSLEEAPKERTMKKTAFTSRKCSCENSGIESSPGKSKKAFKEMYQTVQAQPIDNVLGDEFYAKLVFVDEDSDECDYDGQNLQFRRSSRKH